MNKRSKTRWLKALRSGKYTQGYNQLRTTCNGEHAHCCLGVLADIEGVDLDTLGWQAQVEEGEQGSAGLTCDQMDKLATLNDRAIRAYNTKQTYSFRRIAAHIERYL